MSRVWKDSSLYLIGNIASRAIGFLAIPLYSRFLSPAQYGLLELVELSTQTIAIALGLQAIGAALSRLYYDQASPETERAVVSTALIATAGLSATVMLVAILLARPLSLGVFHTDEWTTLLQAAFVAMFFSNMIEVVLVYERIRDNARFFLIYSLTTITATLSLNILFIGVLGFGVWGFVSSKLVVSLLSSVYMLVRMRRAVGWNWRWTFLPELFRFGAPLVLSSLSYFAIHFSDRFFLSSAVSLAELGRYALSYRFAILVSVLVGDSFAKSWDVKLYRYTEQTDWRQQFARVASYFTYALFATGFAIAVFGPELLRIMVPADYTPPFLLLPILIVSYFAREIGDFFRTLLLINKRSGRVSQIAAAGALLNLAANALLIPRFGIYGAAYATLVTWLAYMVVCWAVANAEHHLPVKPLSYLRLCLLIGVVYAAAEVTRVDAFLLQVVLDGVWTLVFCGLAIPVFLTRDERAGGLALIGGGLLWVLARGRPARADAAGPAELLILDYARSLRPRPVGLGPTRAIVVSAVPSSLEGVVVVPLRPGGGGTVRAASTLLRLGAGALRCGDARLGWLPGAFAAASGTVGPGTVLVSAASPAVNPMLALALKRQHGAPWVAYLETAAAGPAPKRLLARFAAGLAITHADALLVPSEAEAEVLRRRHPARAGAIHDASRMAETIEDLLHRNS